MDRRLTAYVLKYLLEHRFESKAEMARQLGMRQRTIEKVFANLDVAKAGTIAFDKAIYGRISLVAPGTTYPYVATAANGWHAVEIGSKVGWVSGEYSKTI